MLTILRKLYVLLQLSCIFESIKWFEDAKISLLWITFTSDLWERLVWDFHENRRMAGKGCLHRQAAGSDRALEPLPCGVCSPYAVGKRWNLWYSVQWLTDTGKLAGPENEKLTHQERQTSNMTKPPIYVTFFAWDGGFCLEERILLFHFFTCFCIELMLQ